MNLMDLLRSEDVLYRTKMCAEILWQSTFNRFFYGAFGKKSCILKPIRIFGKKHIFVGEKVRVLNHARIEAVTQWEGETFKPRIEIEDNVSIGQNLHMTAADVLKIGKNSLLSLNVTITDIDHQYTNPYENVSKQKIIVRKTMIGENCFIGCGVMIQAGTKLGEHCIVGANSVVRGEFPAYCVIAGAPAHIIKKYNETTKCWERVE